MLFLIWVFLFLTAACLLLFMPALWGKHIYNTFRGVRTVNCPETHSPVAVRFNAFRAAITGLSGKPKLSLTSCSRWPERAGCDQACIPQAECAIPESHLGVARPAGQQVAHLPALVATAAAWLFGAVWHSEYVFRSAWASMVGLTNQEAHDLARTWFPHLLTVIACLAFSYAVAGLLAWVGVRSVWRGVQVAVGLWLVVAGSLFVVARWAFDPEVLRIEGGYSLIGALIVGAIVGGLPRKVLVRDNE